MPEPEEPEEPEASGQELLKAITKKKGNHKKGGDIPRPAVTVLFLFVYVV